MTASPNEIENQSPMMNSEHAAEIPAEHVAAENAGSALVVTEPSAEEPSKVRLKEILASETALSGLPVELKVAIPVPQFRVRDLVTLEKGRVLSSDWANGEDLPLSCGDVQLVWTEFEVVDQKLAVRVTRLA